MANVAAKRAVTKSERDRGEKNGEESEAHEGCVDEGNASGVAETLKGKDSRREDFEADEAHGWCAAPAGISTWYWPRASTLGRDLAVGPLGDLKEAYPAPKAARRAPPSATPCGPTATASRRRCRAAWARATSPAPATARTPRRPTRKSRMNHRHPQARGVGS